MPISECSFCGALSVTENSVCAACEQLMGGQTARQPTEQFSSPQEGFQQFPQGFEGFGSDAVPSNSFHQPRQEVASAQTFEQPTRSFQPPRQQFGGPFQPENTSTCLRCGSVIPRGMSTCDSCPGGKSKSFLKKLAVVAILLVIGYFSYDLGFEMVSARGVVRRYEKATGSDATFDSIVFKGEVDVKQVPGFFNGKSIDMTQVGKIPGAAFDFTMVFQSPGKSAVEMEQGGTTVFKQAYDGTKGWELNRMGGQSSVVDKNDGFGLRKMGVGIDDFDSVEFMDSSAASSFADGKVDNVKSIAQIKVGSETKTIGERVCVKGVSTRNGKPETSVMVFDKSSGLLIGMVKTEKVGDKEVPSVILFDEYRRFAYKGSGPLNFFRSNQVSVPTKWTIAISPPANPQIIIPSPLVMTFNVADVSFDGIFNPQIFNRPPI